MIAITRGGAVHRRLRLPVSGHSLGSWHCCGVVAVDFGAGMGEVGGDGRPGLAETEYGDAHP
ncbi:MAG TPA: hypothetical protein VMM14_05885 [Acidimicrobiia bacterium]|nr:hypothetical protein [Acidimicrobiia bacterium]